MCGWHESFWLQRYITYTGQNESLTVLLQSWETGDEAKELFQPTLALKSLLHPVETEHKSVFSRKWVILELIFLLFFFFTIPNTHELQDRSPRSLVIKTWEIYNDIFNQLHLDILCGPKCHFQDPDWTTTEHFWKQGWVKQPTCLNFQTLNSTEKHFIYMIKLILAYLHVQNENGFFVTK